MSAGPVFMTELTQTIDKLNHDRLTCILSYTLDHRLTTCEILRRFRHYAMVFQTAPIMGESFEHAVSTSRQLIDEVAPDVRGNPTQVEHTFALALAESRRIVAREALVGTQSVLDQQITVIIDYLGDP